MTMTPFERQVADALQREIHDDGWCVVTAPTRYSDCSGRCKEISTLLAPGVVAGIDAACRPGDVSGEWEQRWFQEDRAAALEALRGHLGERSR
jgi:hypothetical protein